MLVWVMMCRCGRVKCDTGQQGSGSGHPLLLLTGAFSPGGTWWFWRLVHSAIE